MLGAQKYSPPWNPEEHLYQKIRCRKCGHRVTLVVATPYIELIGYYHSGFDCHIGLIDDWVCTIRERVINEYEPTELPRRNPDARRDEA